MTTQPRRRDNLWSLTLAPVVWAAHLLLSYATAAVWCAKFAGERLTLGSVPTAIAWYTVAALVAIAVVGVDGLRRHRRGDDTTLDRDTPEDRHRFLGFATLLLAGLSAIGVIYAAVAASFFETCR